MITKDKISLSLTGVLVVCAFVIIGFIIQQNFFPSKPSRSTQHLAKPPTRHVANWRQLSPSGQRTGPKNATIQIIEFFDYQCPFCKRVQPVVKAVRKKYPKKVDIVHVNFPLQSHQYAFDAAVAAECARLQKPTTYMAYHDGLFSQQNKLGQTGFYKSLAKRVGITDTTTFRQCINAQKTAGIVKAGEKLGNKLNIHSIPTFLINDMLIMGALSKKQLNNLVQKTLEKSNK